MNKLGLSGEKQYGREYVESTPNEIIEILRSAQASYAGNKKFVTDAETLVQQLRATSIDQKDEISQIRNEAILLLQSVEGS